MTKNNKPIIQLMPSKYSRNVIIFIDDHRSALITGSHQKIQCKSYLCISNKNDKRNSQESSNL